MRWRGLVAPLLVAALALGTTGCGSQVPTGAVNLPSGFDLQAHRGGRDARPENTLPPSEDIPPEAPLPKCRAESERVYTRMGWWAGFNNPGSTRPDGRFPSHVSVTFLAESSSDWM